MNSPQREKEAHEKESKRDIKSAKKKSHKVRELRFNKLGQIEALTSSQK